MKIVKTSIFFIIDYILTSLVKMKVEGVYMEKFPWWNEKQKKLADEVEDFADEHVPKAAITVRQKRFPWDIMEEVAKRGWFGILIPEKYGGLGKEYGVTACCILAEELSRLGPIGLTFSDTMFGGTHQLVHFGTEEQKEKWLPRIARGEILTGVCVTEPYVGSDAANIETVARKEGDEWVINGKKRFITNAGISEFYLVYAKTSDDPQDRRKYQHLSAFIVEKDRPGLSVERITDLSGWEGVFNGYLDFNEVRVPEENLLGKVGYGWLIMMSGFNLERTVVAAGCLGQMKEALRYAVFHTNRRVQFGVRTADIPVNQFKIADIIWRYRLSRLIVYYAAYLLDQGYQPLLDATTAKLFATESLMKISIDAIQCMGGDGWTKFYPVEEIFRSAKVMEIVAGTNEIMRLILYRQGTKMLSRNLRPPLRRMNKELKLPVPYFKTQPFVVKEDITQEDILKVLADNYVVNPGLYMTKEDIKMIMSIGDEKLDKLLLELEEKELVKLFKGRKGEILMVRPTYKGLKEAYPLEHYKWFPEWLNQEDLR